jgi:4-hydroxythreonine-4-phosphate dehydrogenase
MKRIALTTGEPAGIGLDISLKIAQLNFNADIVAFADPDILQQRAKLLGLDIILDVADKHKISQHQAGILKVKPIKVIQDVIPRKLNLANASYVLETISMATKACLKHEFDALVTAPIHKGIINKAGFNFTGHTEFLAELSNAKQVVMMLATSKLRVALVTTHLPLKNVSKTITKEHLIKVIHILNQDLIKYFAIQKPKILVCGLNPHAGEDGYLGKEEIEIINPVLEQLRKEDLDLIGAVPADTAFINENLAKVDVVLSMYHDQGLPVLKQQGFGKAVNITLGLPFLRISVDHGTALDLVGTDKANINSLYNAILLAISI